jgi:hypothetical protein
MNVKRKGNSFEIKIAKRMTLWASGKKLPMWYWHVGSSGAQATLTHDVNSPMLADVVSIHEYGHFLTDSVVIEIKNDNRANVLDFILTPKRKGFLNEAWEKVRYQADDAERLPWLIFHRPKTSLNYIVLCDNFYLNFESHLCELEGLTSMDGTVFIFELEDFLSTIDPWIFAKVFHGSAKGQEVKERYTEEARLGFS